MTSDAVALEGLVGQPRARDLLLQAVRAKRLSHAYLFVGTAGSGTLDAAYALAEAIVCPAGGDGTCGECLRVRHRTHPDVHRLEPGGVSGYLADQVREVISDAQLTPVRANAKVYILERAEQLNDTSANALLKTLEEPPESVIFILLGTSVDAILPTIVSRCQVVPFQAVSARLVAGQLADACSVTEPEAALALAVAGSATQARDYLESPSRREVRRLVVDALRGLGSCDSWDVLTHAKGIADAVKAPLDELRDRQQAELDEMGDYLSAGALRKMADAHKREVGARTRSGMMEALRAAESLLRDCLLRLEGVAEPPVNFDAADVVGSICDGSSTRGVLSALDAVGRAADDLDHNVSAQLALEVMLCSVKEALTWR